MFSLLFWTILLGVAVGLFALATLGVWWLDITRWTNARRLIANGASLVDVDAPDLFARDHLENAINIPLAELEGRASQLDRARPIVVYGRGRLKAARAAHALRGLGFRDVVSIGTARHPL